MSKTTISSISNDAAMDLAFDTIGKNKQALIFVNSKRSAERLAEDLSSKIRISSPQLDELSQKALRVLSRPTKQCERLAVCLKKGVAFHHAGLAHEQKELVEDSFRNRLVKIIAATPTLAMGVNLPAFRVIMRDVKRYTHQGYVHIPVLEYHQMTGRCGRPGYDEYGEAISIAQSEDDKDDLVERFVRGAPEAIYSKLAVEPVLRTYLLSLIASNLVNTKMSIMEFFGETFWAHQYKDMKHLEGIIEKMLHLLEDWDFVHSSEKSADFESASDLMLTKACGFRDTIGASLRYEDKKYRATALGLRVAELYLDPLTANYICNCLRRAENRKLTAFSFMQMVCHSLEMRPLLKAKMKEYDRLQETLAEHDSELLEDEPSMFEHHYEEFLNSIKTTLFMNEWIEEKDEEYLLETHNIRPGEIRAKLDIADWLLYASYEITRILELQPLLKEIARVRIRLKYGVKEELLPLIRLRNVGRVRARMLFRNNIRDIGDVKKTDITTLGQIVGKQIALDIKEQVEAGIEPIKPGKRKGQIALDDYE